MTTPSLPLSLRGHICPGPNGSHHYELGHCVTVNHADVPWSTHAKDDVVPAGASNEEIARLYAEVAYATVLDALQGARP